MMKHSRFTNETHFATLADIYVQIIREGKKQQPETNLYVQENGNEQPSTKERIRKKEKRKKKKKFDRI